MTSAAPLVDARLSRFTARTPGAFRTDVPIPRPVKPWWDNPRTLLMISDVGTGKTHLCYTLGRRWIAAGRGHAWLVRGEELAALVAPNSDREATIRRAVLADLLILDDLTRVSEWYLSALGEVVDARWSAGQNPGRDEPKRPMVVTSNEPDVKSLVGERIASRLADGAVVLTLTGNDRRRG